MNTEEVRKLLEDSLKTLKTIIPDLNTFIVYEHQVGHKLIFALQAIDPCKECEGENPNYTCNSCHGWKIRGGLQFDPFNVDHIVSKGSLKEMSKKYFDSRELLTRTGPGSAEADFDGDIFTSVDMSLHKHTIGPGRSPYSLTDSKIPLDADMDIFDPIHLARSQKTIGDAGREERLLKEIEIKFEKLGIPKEQQGVEFEKVFEAIPGMLLKQYRDHGNSDAASVLFWMDRYYGAVPVERAISEIREQFSNRNIFEEEDINREFKKILSSIPPSLRSNYSDLDVIAVYQFMDTYYYG